MLAYTAVDGLRVISRDFDFDWQPEVSETISASSRDRRGSLRDAQRFGQYSLAVLGALLSFGTAWLR